MIKRFGKFLVVGGFGFILDFATMTALLRLAHWAPIPARFGAFAVALVFTYFLNRAFTFADRPRGGRREWITYAVVSIIAALVNLGVFVAALRLMGDWSYAPYVAMPLGTGAGLCVNFFAYNFVVFRES